MSCSNSDKKSQENMTSNEPINFKLASTYPSTLTILGTMAKRFEEQINIISGGNIKFRFFFLAFWVVLKIVHLDDGFSKWIQIAFPPLREVD